MEFISSVSPEMAVILFVAAFAGACIDVIAGGGSLITLPALLLAQIPPAFALGTNKVQNIVGTFTACAIMLKKKLFDWNECRIGMPLAFAGSLAGAITVQFIPQEALRFIIPALLLMVGLYLALVPEKGLDECPPKISDVAYQTTVAPAVGFYEGFFGPGTGKIYAVAGNILRGYSIVTANIHSKPLNIAANFASLTVFLLSGKVVWMIAGIMMLGQVAGGYVGTHLVINKGRKLIRPVSVLMCFGMIVKYVFFNS